MQVTLSGTDGLKNFSQSSERQFKNITLGQLQTKQQDLVINDFDDVDQVYSIAYDFAFLLANEAEGFIYWPRCVAK